MPLRGAPLRLTRDLADAIAQDVAAGVSLKHAAESRSLGFSTLLNWLTQAQAEQPGWHTDAEPIEPESLEILRYFSDVVRVARAKRGAELERATGLVVKTGTKRDAMKSKGALEILKAHPAYRAEWGLHVQVEHTGSVEHRLSSASDDELRSLAGWDDALALPGATAPEAP